MVSDEVLDPGAFGDGVEPEQPRTYSSSVIRLLNPDEFQRFGHSHCRGGVKLVEPWVICFRCTDLADAFEDPRKCLALGDMRPVAAVHMGSGIRGELDLQVRIREEHDGLDERWPGRAAFTCRLGPAVLQQ